MPRGLWLSIVLISACSGGNKTTEIPKSNKPLTPKDIVQRSSPAIVRIEAQGDGGEQFGTGFIVDKSGVVATNFHVLEGTKDIKVKLFDGTHLPVMQVLNADKFRDLIVIKIDADKPLPTLRLGDSSKASTGEKIVAIGNPLGVFENTVSEGLISSIREFCSAKDVANKNPGCLDELTFLQISAPISQGSSGGPLFNQVGEVIGVTAAIIAQGQLINFAIPVNYLKPLLSEKQKPIAVEDFAKATKKEPTKKPDRPDFGINGFPVSVYDGCKPDQIADVVKAIEDAIALGAPLYNRGDIEACFRIYEGLAAKQERDAPCKGVRGVFGDVLLKVQSADSFGEKAWHLRYTFDGLHKAAENWAKAKGLPSGKPEPKKK